MMGAVDFAVFVQSQSPGESTQQCYDRAVEAAQFQYGHDPYNGTISTTSGFVIGPTVKTKVEAVRLADEYWEYENQAYDNPRAINPLGNVGPEKWGPAVALPVLDPLGVYFFGLAAS